MTDKQLLAYFGHHKCATRWIRTIFSRICKKLSLKLELVNSPKRFNRDLKTFVRTHDVDFIVYTNADINHVCQLENFKGFHVIRDPRDIAVSSYFSHMYSHPTHIWKALIKHREKLQTLTKTEGLFLDMEFIHQDVFERIKNWNYSQPNVLEIKMEDLIYNPFEKFVEILDHLEIVIKEYKRSTPTKISLKKLNRIVYKNRFSVLSRGRKPGEENLKSHFRKGIQGDWMNHFTEDHKKYFKEKYNDLLVQLGYEKDHNW